MRKPLAILQIGPPEQYSGLRPDLSPAMEALRVGAGLAAWGQLELILIFAEPAARLLFPLDALDETGAETAAGHGLILQEAKASLRTLAETPISPALPPRISRESFATLLSRADHLMRF